MATVRTEPRKGSSSVVPGVKSGLRGALKGEREREREWGEDHHHHAGEKKDDREGVDTQVETSRLRSQFAVSFK